MRRSNPSRSIATGRFAVAPLQQEHRSFQYKGRGRVVIMAIKTFLHLAAQLDRPDEGKVARIKAALAEKKRLADIPLLALRWRGNSKSDTALEVRTHEGRHRALTLLEHGYTHMPVILDVPFRWSEQHDPSSFDYSKRWPTKIIPEGRPRAKAVPFPISREDAGRWSAVRVNPRQGGRAKVGGEIGVNGEFYEGGKFMPSKADRPKTPPAHLQSGRKAEIEPGLWAERPVDWAIPIWGTVKAFADHQHIRRTGVVRLNDDLGFDQPGWAYSSRAELQVLVDALNAGARWMMSPHSPSDPDKIIMPNPLRVGKARAAISANIRELIRAGHQRKQAVAIALRVAGVRRNPAWLAWAAALPLVPP